VETTFNISKHCGIPRTIQDKAFVYIFIMASEHSNRTVLGYCLIIAIAPILFGLDYGGTAGFLAMPSFLRDFGSYNSASGSYAISASNQTLLTGLPLAMACVAAAFSGLVGTYLGRRFGLGLCMLASVIGPAVQASAVTWPVVVVGRSISGLGLGFCLNFAVPYWSEITPASLRGSVVVMYQAVINVATFFAQCINEGTRNIDSRWAYRIPLLIQLLPPLVFTAFLLWIPDTPRWYISRGKMDKGLQAMRRLRGPTYTEEEIQKEVRDIAAFLEMELELEGSVSYLDCFRGTDLRRTLLTIGISLAQAFSGIAFISSYGTFFFSISGISNPFIITVVTGVCGILGSAASFFLVRYFGRRELLIGGSFLCGISMLIFAIVGVAAPGSTAAAKCLVVFVCLFIFSYGATWGPVTEVVVGEISSNKLRSKTVSFGTMVTWASDILIVCSIPYLINPNSVNLGAKVGFIFGGCEIAIFIWTILYLPETKDRTLEEIDEMFMNGVPALKFKSYITTGEVRGLTVQGQLDKMEKKAIETIE